MLRSLALVALALLTEPAFGQRNAVPPRHYPINQHSPPGRAGLWAAQAGRFKIGYFQPVKVILPAAGKVTFFDGSLKKPVTANAPSQLALEVGRSYRFQIQLGNTVLYPTVELVDQLHPPEGQKHNYPVPLVFTKEEIQAVMTGKALTKVVYLEQPNLALPRTRSDQLAVSEIDPQVNAVAEADHRGRPMAILRLGSRLPDPADPDPKFFGRLHRVLPSKPTK